jgi:hypothetical protein
MGWFKAALLAMVAMAVVSMVYIVTLTRGAQVTVISTITEHDGSQSLGDIQISHDGQNFVCVIGDCCDREGGISRVNLSTGVLECKRGKAADHCGCTVEGADDAASTDLSVDAPADAPTDALLETEAVE